MVVGEKILGRNRESYSQKPKENYRGRHGKNPPSAFRKKKGLIKGKSWNIEAFRES